MDAYCFVAGTRESTTEVLEVHAPDDGRLVGVAGVPGPAQVERAVSAAAAAAGACADLPAHARAAALDHVSRRLAERAVEIAALISAENGKPVKWAAVEVNRAVSTFRWAAEEARRFGGEMQRLDTDPAAAGRAAIVRRFPRGPVLGIAPFNFPLNLVAHKVAPAIAVGAPIIVKPAPGTPLTALLLGELLAETELPAGAWSVLPVPNDRMAPLVADPRLPVVSFTGSGPVGWRIADAVPRKHVTLELGGNAAAVVCADWPDLEAAARRVALFGNYQAGQSCIAVQRVFVAASVYHTFGDHLVDAVAALDFDTEVGPVINDAAAERIESWIGSSGGRVLVGGGRDGRRVQPTVIVDADPKAEVNTEEIFGPVLVLSSFETVEEAFALVNDSQYGLQAGVFTRDLPTAFAAHRALAVGGVIIGDVPSFRADQMPYGGSKGSGVGREGVRSAMDDYTEQRVLVLNAF
ncbi:aldehyde dehydrogenase family protein [Longispora fulva]|uniref:Acyl-CoA reductase-like NAD-dependent aldehyde dehydrogenase n=1 Tax=Longispora fulva TaxID=619741 RepID=A0A8J7GJB6_9ACTN|nr:aldehyde dehydrogenase family protein [Longispora fulva]MBG6140379.1 acyl-CoA reductase-like NAD-dependent aldehyde dehydrogenase [Longispora fulva]